MNLLLGNIIFCCRPRPWILTKVPFSNYSLLQLPYFAFQFHADSSTTLPYPLNCKAPPAHELESDGSDGVDSAGIFVHESTQVRFLCF